MAPGVPPPIGWMMLPSILVPWPTSPMAAPLVFCTMLLATTQSTGGMSVPPTLMPRPPTSVLFTMCVRNTR